MYEKFFAHSVPVCLSASIYVSDYVVKNRTQLVTPREPSPRAGFYILDK